MKKRTSKNLDRIFETVGFAEGLEFMLSEDFDIDKITPAQRKKLEDFCKCQSYDYLALCSLLSAIINEYTQTLNDIDVVIAILGTIIDNLLLLRTIRLTCENNIVSTSKGLDPVSSLAPGILFGLDEGELALSRRHKNHNINVNNKKNVKKIKKIKKVKKRKKEV